MKTLKPLRKTPNSEDIVVLGFYLIPATTVHVRRRGGLRARVTDHHASRRPFPQDGRHLSLHLNTICGWVCREATSRHCGPGAQRKLLWLFAGRVPPMRLCFPRCVGYQTTRQVQAHTIQVCGLRLSQEARSILDWHRCPVLWHARSLCSGHPTSHNTGRCTARNAALARLHHVSCTMCSHRLVRFIR